MWIARRGRIDGPGSLKRLDVDREMDKRIEGANGADVTCLRALNAQVLRLAVDAFTGRTLVVDDLVEGTLSIQGDTHQPPSFLVDVLDTAFLAGETARGRRSGWN